MSEKIKQSREQDEKFMRQALNEALRALDKREVPIGAVVVAGDRVIGRGHNLVETLMDATAHAEMQAITAAMSALGGKYHRSGLASTPVASRAWRLCCSVRIWHLGRCKP